jgi:protein SSD1
MLKLAITKDSVMKYTTADVTKIAKQCNQQKNAARSAQDASQNLFLCCYLSKLEEEKLICTAHVNKVGTRSVDVVLFQYGIEQAVWIEDILDETDGLEQVDGGIEVHWKGKPVQRIEMFSIVKVKVTANLDHSPPSIKLHLLAPEV